MPITAYMNTTSSHLMLLPKDMKREIVHTLIKEYESKENDAQANDVYKDIIHLSLVNKSFYTCIFKNKQILEAFLKIQANKIESFKKRYPHNYLFMSIKLRIPVYFKHLLNRQTIHQMSHYFCKKRKKEYYVGLLSFAISAGYIPIIKRLLTYKNINLNQTDNKQQTPLHWAVFYNSPRILQLLLSHKGINVNAKDKYGQTPLFVAIRNNCIELAQILLKNPACDFSLRNNDSNTLLHVAACNNYIKLTRLLLTYFEVNTCNKRKRTPLYFAAANGHTEIVEILLADPKIDVNKSDWNSETPLHMACKNGHVEVVKLLIEHSNISVNAINNTSRTPLSWAVFCNYVHIVKLLLKQKNIDINIAEKFWSETPLDIAIKKGYKKIEKLLRAYSIKSLKTYNKKRKINSISRDNSLT